MEVTPATVVSLPSQLDFRLSLHAVPGCALIEQASIMSFHVFSERNSGDFVMEFSQRQEKAGSRLRPALSARSGILPAAGVYPFSRPAKQKIVGCIQNYSQRLDRKGKLPVRKSHRFFLQVTV